MFWSILHAFNFKGKEWVYYLLAALVAVVATAALVFEKAKPKENPAGLRQIGALKASGTDVKRKFFSEIDFQEVAEKDTVYLKDTIFVGPKSKVNLALGEYGDFELSPNSVLLVYLDFENKTATTSIASKSSVGQALKLKLTQGEIKYKKPARIHDAAEPIKSVAIEIADNTFLKLDEQEELKIERTKSGEITVHEATVAPVVEKLPDLLASTETLTDNPTDQSASQASLQNNSTPVLERFELKVGESFKENEIKLHANLISQTQISDTISDDVKLAEKETIKSSEIPVNSSTNNLKLKAISSTTPPPRV